MTSEARLDAMALLGRIMRDVGARYNSPTMVDAGAKLANRTAAVLALPYLLMGRNCERIFTGTSRANENENIRRSLSMAVPAFRELQRRIAVVRANHQQRPHPFSAVANAIHPDWTGESQIGLSWSFIGKQKIKGETGDFAKGDLVSPRGGITKGVFILLSEWTCDGDQKQQAAPTQTQTVAPHEVWLSTPALIAACREAPIVDAWQRKVASKQIRNTELIEALRAATSARQCLSYLWGYVAGNDQGAVSQKLTAICVPANVSGQQLAAVFLKWADAHPERWNVTPSEAVFIAFVDAWSRPVNDAAAQK
jgi:hypothetical protein